MPKDIRWVEQHLEIDPPKRPKKMTATRLASVLGLNPWSSPFEAWCAITRTWEKPFEDTKYTIAGKTIEPKQIAYMRRQYQMDNLATPTDLYGEDYFKTTMGDFFPNVRIFGGMWDSLLMNDQHQPDTVLEFKTTSRIEDWKDDIPEYYALQAALYAFLLRVENVVMICSALENTDYDAPEKFEPTVANTFTRQFRLHERYPDFEDKLNYAVDWWQTYVEGGISPNYDEKHDAEILTALRTVSVDVRSEDDLTALLKEADTLKDEIELEEARLKDKNDRLKVLTEKFKDVARQRFGPNDKYVELAGDRYLWKMTRSYTTKLDDKRLKADGLYDQYAISQETYRMTSVRKGE